MSKTMGYKLPSPDDYKGDEAYQYKVVEAYSDLWSMTMKSLIHIDALIDMIGVEYTEPELIKERLEEIIKEYKS